jgi:hypothetical protein
VLRVLYLLLEFHWNVNYTQREKFTQCHVDSQPRSPDISCAEHVEGLLLNGWEQVRGQDLWQPRIVARLAPSHRVNSCLTPSGPDFAVSYRISSVLDGRSLAVRVIFQ